MQAHIGILETAETQAQLLTGLDYLVNISYVDNTEVFKTCLDYWWAGGCGSPYRVMMEAVACVKCRQPTICV